MKCLKYVYKKKTKSRVYRYQHGALNLNKLLNDSLKCKKHLYGKYVIGTAKHLPTTWKS